MSNISQLNSIAGDGIILGLANTIVIGICLAISLHEPIAQVVVAVVIIGFIPASLIGLTESWIAHGLATRPVWIRIAVLLPLPMLSVLAMAEVVGIREYAVGACIPTLVAVLILERASRAVQLVPRAIAT